MGERTKEQQNALGAMEKARAMMRKVVDVERCCCF